MAVPIRILYVDDNAHDRELVRDALEREHDRFQVTAVRSRAEFEEQLAAGDFDLVLSDFNILGFTGLQVLDAVRSRLSRVPVVIVTGTGSEEVGVEAMKRGAADYVIKTPRHIQRLPQSILTVLENLRLQEERERVDSQLRESEALFHTLARGSPVGIFRTDAGGECTYVNERWSAIAGLDAQSVLGRGWTKTVHPDEQERITALWLQSVAAGKAFSAEFRFLRSDRQITWVLGQGLPELNERGEIRGYVGTITDITERNRDRQALELQAQIIDQIHDAVAEVDMDGIVRRWNKGSERLLGYTAEEMIGQSIERIYPAESLRFRQTRVIEPVLRNGEHEAEVEHVCKDGRHIWVHLSLSLLRDEAGKPIGTLGYSIEITERLRIEADLRMRANHDELTGLANRRAVREALDRILAGERADVRHVGVIVLNLDRLHHVNDTLGYSAGDLVLVEAAKRLSNLAAAFSCIAGRIGGDEFVLVTGIGDSTESFESLAREATRVLAQPYSADGQSIYLTCSAGVSWSPDAGSDAAQLLGQADLALNLAKQRGRNQLVLYSAERSADLADRIEVGTQMRAALQRQEIVLHYQPLVDVHYGGIACAEALMRWYSTNRGSIGPGRFIPIAEDTGMIVPLGDWALRSAIARLGAWQAAGRRVVPLSVNVSAVQFQRAEFIAEVEDALHHGGIAPALLKIEITESVVMHDTQTAVLLLNRLRQLGVRISLDDFGTGYSSLGYLRRLPIDEIKIDQSFISDIIDDSYAASLCRAIIAMSRQLHLTVVAEGIETSAQAHFLKEAGCQLLQGFLFSQAVPTTQLEELLVGNARWALDGRRLDAQTSVPTP